uniref:ATP synthase F0 subunit 8 n=1 Tax=Stenamma megamanni TaxID=1504014 RepID=UPI001FCCDB6F|nr:ATP synthase F0 subunit 8 [Stenamma megamanni]UNZ99574.1 ATP synthase F0 subunit 8 [Stenamma megamanni]
MPQMKPIMWLFMLNYTIILLLITISFIYFFYNTPPLTMPNSPLPPSTYIKWNWKW